jgi:hypothetical protein
MGMSHCFEMFLSLSTGKTDFRNNIWRTEFDVNSVFHGFRLRYRDDYFPVKFDHLQQGSFFEAVAKIGSSLRLNHHGQI